MEAHLSPPPSVSPSFYRRKTSHSSLLPSNSSKASTLDRPQSSCAFLKSPDLTKSFSPSDVSDACCIGLRLIDFSITANTRRLYAGQPNRPGPVDFVLISHITMLAYACQLVRWEHDNGSTHVSFNLLVSLLSWYHLLADFTSSISHGSTRHPIASVIRGFSFLSLFT